MSESPPESEGVNLGGLGDIDMYPEEAYEVARRLHTIGVDFGAVWDALRTEIDAKERLIGKGPLGEQFRLTYNSFAEAILPSTNQVSGVYQEFGAVASRAVKRYVETENGNAARFQGLEGRAPGGDS